MKKLQLWCTAGRRALPLQHQLTVQIFSGSSSCTISGMMSFAYASTKATHWNQRAEERMDNSEVREGGVRVDRVR